MPNRYQIIHTPHPHHRPPRLPTRKQLTLLWMLWKGWGLSEAARKLHISRQGAWWRLEGLKRRGIVAVKGTAGKPVVHIYTDPHHFVGKGGFVGWRSKEDLGYGEEDTDNTSDNTHTHTHTSTRHPGAAC